MMSTMIVRRIAYRQGKVILRSVSSQTAKRSQGATTSSVIQATNFTWSGPPPTADTINRTSQTRQAIFPPAASLDAVKVQNTQPSRTVVHHVERNAESNIDTDVLMVDMESLEDLASKEPTPLRLSDMYRYALMSDPAQRLRNAQFLHAELPIRIAQRAIDLLTLPHGLNESEPIRNVAHIYLRYLSLFENCATPTTEEQEEKFTEILTGIMLDRTSIPMDIARGIQTWQDERREDLDPSQRQEMEDALYRFFTARVGLRFLTEHHILSSPKRDQYDYKLSDDSKESSDDFLGCIQTDCNPVEEVTRVAAEVTRHTKEHFNGICPEIDIVNVMEDGKRRSFTYVPHHLQYMVAELLKNSCRATVRNYLASNPSATDEIPSIRVVIVNGAEDVSIKIADRGGGVPRSTMKQIFKFAHSTADAKDAEFSRGSLTGGHDIRGFGLPLCRIYARYFGGELTLKSMEGYGLDAYLYLPRLGEACENLPLSVHDSPGGQISMPTGRRAYSTSQSPLSARSTKPDKNESRRILSMLNSRAL